MENYVILGAVALIVAVGAWSTVKHFKGEGGCCGGGGYKPPIAFCLRGALSVFYRSGAKRRFAYFFIPTA